MLNHFSCDPLFVILGTVAHQAPLSMGFSKQEYWSGLPCPPPGDLPDPGIEPMSLTSPALAGRLFATRATWEAPQFCSAYFNSICDYQQIQYAHTLLPKYFFSNTPENFFTANQALRFPFISLTCTSAISKGTFSLTFNKHLVNTYCMYARHLAIPGI